MASAARTDVGRCRTENQDAFLTLPDHGVFCVADGIGGALRGAEASRAAVRYLRRAFTTPPEDKPVGHTLEARKERAVEAVNRASEIICSTSREAGIRGSGTTAVILLLDEFEHRGTVLHAGDSRAYRYRTGRLEILTRDHNLATEAGIPHEQQEHHPMHHVITRAVGVRERVHLEERMVEARKHDVFMLASDGLHRMMSDKSMEVIFQMVGVHDLHRLATALVDEANRAGGEDNITLVLARVDGIDRVPTQESGAGGWASRLMAMLSSER